ncbi:thioesterase II family protein [Nocardia cyriacigeorgica]|uniref:thioesterase II family protein n=1 Tax=Nocardia cyriacigeorgica TaxID=135487 RepID=UPI0018934465|nr:alpha/beta fold hydrolase [Nocardia cyriacigeorgica]MBF6286126.1 thioesterase [Nocardia cyriacigeorgica]
MPKPLGWIRKFHKSAAENSPLLLMFPHAGSGASAYRSFSKALSEHFEVIVFQYPGRQDRAGEPPAETLPDLAAGALSTFLDSEYHRGEPFSVFGHSMGAVTGFEFVRQAEAAGLRVDLLCASGAVAPFQVVDMPAHPTEDEQLLDHLAALNGTGTDVLASREIMRMTLPALKADYAAFDRYDCGPDVKIQARMHILGGSDDEHVTARHLRDWAQHSDRDVTVSLFDGGHFYLNDHVADIADLLASEILSAR